MPERSGTNPADPAAPGPPSVGGGGTATALLQAALDASREGILMVDLNGRVAGHNQEFARLWQIPVAMTARGDDEEMIAHVLGQLRDPGAFVARVREVYAMPEAECFDVLHFVDGRVVERYSRPQRIGDVVVGRVWCFRDVTPRARAEEALRESQERLLQSQKMEIVGRLAGGVAHDFNNLLTIIGGHAQILVERIPRYSPLHRSANDIQRAADHAAALTGRLLAFSRKRIVEPRVVDLHQVVRDLLPLVRRLLREDIQLDVRLDGGPAAVKMDPVEIEQVLLNLTANARDAMPAGGVVQLLGQPGAAGEVELILSDTGTGMSSETAARIFEPFFTTKQGGEGTGLGLATVQDIVRAAGGTIVVESVPDAGTRFVVRLPRVEGDVPGALTGPMGVARGKGERILVVEDAADIRSLVEEVLIDAGYRVVAAADGAEALVLGSRERVDLVLCDVVLPRLSGVDLVARLRQARPDLRVLFMSGYGGGQDGRLPLPPGAAHIAKPFRLDALVRRVGEALAGA